MVTNDHHINIGEYCTDTVKTNLPVAYTIGFMHATISDGSVTNNSVLYYGYQFTDSQSIVTIGIMPNGAQKNHPSVRGHIITVGH